MLPAVQIADDNLRVTDWKLSAQAADNCRYRLPCAEKAVWKDASWQLVEQAYDVPNVYASYIEVRCGRPDAVIPIRCPRHDLYWLYVLEGRLGIASAHERRSLVAVHSGCYRVSYLPAGAYTCQFSEGIHRIFYVVHKPASLFREESREVSGADVFTAVQNQLDVHAATDSLALSDGSGRAIHRFLTAPGESYLARMHRIKQLAYELIVLSHRSMMEQEGEKKSAADWVTRMKAYIDECIACGDQIDTFLVAERFRISVGYVRALFTRVLGVPIGGYITERKLVFSKTLLKMDSNTAQTAHYLGWTRSHFSMKFAARFGESPSAYRKRNTGN